MTFQVPSDFLTELLRLEREKSKVLSLADSWGVDLQEQEEKASESLKNSIKEASSSTV